MIEREQQPQVAEEKKGTSRRGQRRVGRADDDPDDGHPD